MNRKGREEREEELYFKNIGFLCVFYGSILYD